MEDVAKRATLSQYKKILLKVEPSCFYCVKPLSIVGADLEIDHFIPWSFIHDDQLWNLVQTCHNYNHSKKDYLASKTFLTKFIIRNEMFKNIKLNNLAMQNYATEKYQLIYNNALINGFSYDWNPKKSNIN